MLVLSEMQIFYKKMLKVINNFISQVREILIKKENISLKDIVKDHIDNEKEFTIEEKEMLTNIIGFGKSRVEDSMVPRADIISADINTSADSIIKLFSDCNHSRIVIFRENLDDPIGMLHIKDFVGALSEKNIKDISLDSIVKDILFVPPSMKSRELLLKMQVSRIHMALVVDEYGGTDGLLTIENLIEEIVGEIEDEHSNVETHKINISENFIDIPARTTLQEVEDIIGFELKNESMDEEIETIGGLVFLLVGRVPQRGELISHPRGFEIEIREVDQRKIINVRFRIKVKQK